MRTRTTLFLIAATIAIAACAPPAPAPSAAPAAAQPGGVMRYLIDPRTGFTATPLPNIDRRFSEAWRLEVSGDFAGARRKLDDILNRDGAYLPARLAIAAIDIKENRLADAKKIVDRALERIPQYTAARVYDAEIALAQNRTRAAYDIYHSLARQPNAPPTVLERDAELGKELFDRLFAEAQAASGDQAIRLLREALALQPGARPARMLLVQKLLAMHELDQAKQELDPLVAANADSDDVQEALAEIDAGNRRYQEAIVRYERLARRTNDPRYAKRLDELKEDFAEANMPPQYQRAVEDNSITRDDLAVIMYWKIASVRFAQNLGAPPIAIDIGEIPGRDEVIRAIALGIYNVDPVTRRVSPHAPVNASALVRTAARVLLLRGAPCARQAASDPTDIGRAQKVLAACSISDPSLTDPTMPVSGRDAAAVMEQVGRALK